MKHLIMCLLRKNFLPAQLMRIWMSSLTVLLLPALQWVMI